LSTVNKIELEKFSKLAKEWWDPNGKFKPLHLFNPLRIEFIKKKIISHFKIKSKGYSNFEKINLLDIGCGGGLLCEPLKRLGAKVTGIDASKKNIEIAKLHSKEMGLNINYIHSAPENLKFDKKFNVILNMEVVEHVSNVDLFIHNCSRLLDKNGIMFVSTINKNLKSYLFAIVGAEYVLRWLPIGTHNWESFLTPEKLEAIATKNSFKLDETTGMKFNILEKKWYNSKDTSVNYISTFIKN